MSETIAALATPYGEGGISIIRLSGGQSRDIAGRLFYPAAANAVPPYQPQRVYFGEIRDPATGHCVDEVLLTFFKAPKSYTCEDVIEFSSHGGLLVSATILRLVLDQGARMAEPGEFTRRAFLNGRLDLSQAEAVADLIAAASETALRSAVAQMQGKLSERVNDCYDRLLAVLAQLEAAIDFPEEGLDLQSTGKTLEQVTEVRTRLQQLIQTYRQGKIYREGARVALVGKPNVGKSSLLNALLQEDRAIVTPYPGTTRDVLEEKVRIKDIHINIIDSAGLRHDPETIEKEGIARTRAALGGADLVLVIFDGSRPLDANDQLLLQEVEDKPRLGLINKIDLPQQLATDPLQSKFSQLIPVSAKTLAGMDDLIDAIHNAVLKAPSQGGVPSQGGTEPVVITRERHRELLTRARDALATAEESLEQKASEELVAVDVNLALTSLGSLLGREFADDLLDQIFNAFCIGK